MYVGSYGNMMNYVAGQKSDGEVERREFIPSPSASGWPAVTDEEMRKRVESFVLKNLPEAHKFEGRDGEVRVIYLDERGRAVDGKMSSVPDADLVRMARRYGMKLGTNGSDEPQTSSTNHGYSKPATTEERALAEASDVSTTLPADEAKKAGVKKHGGGSGEIKSGCLVDGNGALGIFMSWNTKSKTVNIVYAKDNCFDLEKIKKLAP